jgi:hypothetical protein
MMGDLNDLRLFLARAGCIYTKAGLSPPFYLPQFAETWLLDGIDLKFCVHQIISHLDQHATFYRSGSGDGTLPPLNHLIRKRWRDLHKPPRVRPERTDRLWKRNEELDVASPATEPLEISVAPAQATIAAPKRAPVPPRQKQIDEAVAFLLKELANDPVPATVIQQYALDDGIALRTLDRARAQLKVVTRRSGFGRSGRSWLSLPAGDTSA